MGTCRNSARVRCPRYARAGRIPRARARPGDRTAGAATAIGEPRVGAKGLWGTPFAGKLPGALDATAGVRASPPLQACARGCAAVAGRPAPDDRARQEKVWGAERPLPSLFERQAKALAVRGARHRAPLK